jgi:uncharacterized protein (UPF0548 family)
MPDGVAGSPSVQRRLAGLAGREPNFDPATAAPFTGANGWNVVDLCQELPPEAAGPPLRGGSWEIACRLMRGYEFADPSIVRAYYDPAAPLEGRTMLLKLTAFGLVHVYVGVRVVDVYRQLRTVDDAPVDVWGWAYRTLQGHVEMGEMSWEAWKWRDSGRVEFRVHAYARRAHITNPLVRLGFQLTGGHERRAFLESTLRRMLLLTTTALHQGESAADIAEVSATQTARHTGDSEAAAHEELARHLRDGEPPPR